jgi:uncharacterized protein YprB with RNaseH-like and TPR domain
MEFESLKHILFLDIETVAGKKSFEELEERFQPLWEKKTKNLKTDQTPEESYSDRAAIYAEFGKILVIGLGYFAETPEGLVFRCKSISGEDEKQVLQEFTELLNQISAKEAWKLCAHNGKEFDFPYICRRLIINQLPLPKILQQMGRKPWETPYLDTMEMWKFGDFKAYTSLELMAACLGIPGSKDDIDGSQVGKVYFESGDVERIATYCRKDVVVLAQVYMRLMGLGILEEDQIQMI